MDLTPDALFLVKARHGGQKPEIVAASRVPRPRGAAEDTPEFANWLGSAVREFCGRDRCSLWACLPDLSRGVTKRLYLPKLSERDAGPAVLWEFKKESPFPAEEFLLDYEVERTTVQEGQARLAVCAYAAPQADTTSFTERFGHAGLQLTGLTLSPCTYRNLVRAGWAGGTADTLLGFLHIGLGATCISILTRTGIAYARSVRSGLGTILEPLTTDATGPRTPEQAAQVLALLESIPARPLRPHGGGGSVLHDLTGNSPEVSGPAAMVLPALRRLVSNIVRTLEAPESEVKPESIDTFCVTGDVVAFPPLLRHIEASLGHPLVVLDPFEASRFDPGEAAPDPATRSAFARAVGLSLSGHLYTPNLLHTRFAQERVQATEKTQWWVVGLFALFAAVALGVNSWLGFRVRDSHSARADLTKRLAQYVPPLELKDIQALAVKAKTEQEGVARLCQDYLCLAVIREVFALTPPGVRLLSLDAELGAPSAREAAEGEAAEKAKREAGSGGQGTGGKEGGGSAAPKPKQSSSAKANRVVLEGVIPGDPQAAVTILTIYMHSLDRSLILRAPVLEETVTDVGEGDAVLRFRLRVSLADY